jgi:FtsP/CotA-like multicopper oxidase with cupredoxin domain
MRLDRRTLLAGVAMALAPAVSRSQGSTSDEARPLVAAPLPYSPRPGGAALEGWAFDGRIPAEPLRMRQGEEVRVRLENRTGGPLSLHWHGLRNVSVMDGVGGLSQPPVRPGESFTYRLAPPDGGTTLIRPLIVDGGSSEAAERGLTGLLIVEEQEPPIVDRDVPLLFDDWLLTDAGALAPFGQIAETAGFGRLGNLITVAGTPVPHLVEAAPGSRLRLRFANASNARVLSIRFDQLKVYVAAVDGQPTDVFEPLRSTLPFGPGTRYDLIVELPGEPGAEGRIMGLIGPGLPLVTVRSTGDPLRRDLPPIGPLPKNERLPAAIRLQNATRPNLVIGGGARPGPDGSARYEGDPRRIWTVNGAPGSASSAPLFRVRRGTPVVIAINNQTAFVQPMHLHGHHFRLLHPFDDGWEPFWLDTLPVPAGRTVRIAFDADNPGRWAISSTVLERFDTGLWTWFEVT